MGSGRSQEIIRKPHLKKKIKNGSTKISVLDIRIDSMQHFPHPLLFMFFILVDGLSPILVGWEGPHAFKMIFKGARPQQCRHSKILFIHPAVVLQSKRLLLHG